MDLYERFLLFEVVVNVKTEKEYEEFKQRCKECRLKSIQYMNKISFDNLHKTAGIQKYKVGDVCIEFQLGKGFTFSTKKEYENWGCEIISVQDFLNATEI